MISGKGLESRLPRAYISDIVSPVDSTDLWRFRPCVALEHRLG